MKMEGDAGVDRPDGIEAGEGASRDARRQRARKGFWRIADPKITLASVAGLALGTCLAADAGPLSVPWLAITVLGIFAFEAAKNASGEIFDFDSGADRGVEAKDRSPFSGGKRVLVDGLLTRRQVGRIAAAFYGVGILSGLVIVVFREPAVLWFGLVGAGLAFAYHARPIALSYRGWGELAVGIAYGPLITVGTYLVQRGDTPFHVLAASLPLGLLVASFLWINEFPDAEADAAAGKRTWVVRLGKRRASRAFALLVAVAFFATAIQPLLGFDRGLWLGLAGLPAGLAAARRLGADPHDTARTVPAQAWTLASFLLYAFGAGAGVLLL
ncbi:MAG: prenyltransferase [Gemmatimonadota bacterium]|nr:prenyltransferase [Gemmatimonadota bacterium]